MRLAQGKSHYIIIDFIGNYRNVDLKLSVFDAEEKAGGNKTIQPQVP